MVLLFRSKRVLGDVAAPFKWGKHSANKLYIHINILLYYISLKSK